MNFGMHLTVDCPLCGQPEHASGCPRQILDDLIARQKHLPCPACVMDEVDINSKDLYECRACHTQFSRSEVPIIDPIEECKKTMLTIDLDAPFSKGMVAVWQLATKGTGDFLVDKAILSQQFKIRRLLQRRKYQKKKKV